MPTITFLCGACGAERPTTEARCKCMGDLATDKWRVTFDDMSLNNATGPALDALYERYVDPWVQVGTTTIDGTFTDLAEAFGVPASGVGASIHGLIDGERVVSVRGMNLRPCEWVTFSDNVGMVLCDIVRRQSEIDVEKRARFERAMKAWDDAFPGGLGRVPCPECGPHGNAGRVLLLESWVDCTTCRPTAAALSVEFDDASSLRHDPIIAETYPTEVSDPFPAGTLPLRTYVRHRDGVTCRIDAIHKNEPRYLLWGIDGYKDGWSSSDEVKALDLGQALALGRSLRTAEDT